MFPQCSLHMYFITLVSSRYKLEVAVEIEQDRTYFRGNDFLKQISHTYVMSSI